MKRLSKDELKKYDLDPEKIETLRKRLEEVAQGKDWTLGLSRPMESADYGGLSIRTRRTRERGRSLEPLKPRQPRMSSSRSSNKRNRRSRANRSRMRKRRINQNRKMKLPTRAVRKCISRTSYSIMYGCISA